MIIYRKGNTTERGRVKAEIHLEVVVMVVVVT